MKTGRALLQYLQAFTVQIRHGKYTERVDGTGVIVSADGKVATAAHVVEKAGVVINNRSRKNKEVGIYFPAIEGHNYQRSSLLARASVWGKLSGYNDDIVLLQLLGGVDQTYLRHCAHLGSAEDSFQNEFVSYGFATFDEYKGFWAHGRILGSPEKPKGHLFAPFQLDSSDFEVGLSGAAILDSKRNLVVGFFSRFHKQRRWLGYAVNAVVLKGEPFNLQLFTGSRYLEPAPSPLADPEEAKAAASKQREVSWNGAPEKQRNWVGCDDLIAALDQDWTTGTYRVSILTGFGGEGKSSIVRCWLDRLYSDQNQGQSQGIFWWTFSESRTAELFFDEALRYFKKPSFDISTIQSTGAKANLLAAMLHENKYIFVLDQLEVVQYQSGDQHGHVINPELRDFLQFFGAPTHQSFCVITTRLAVSDLARYIKTAISREVGRLNPSEGAALLRKIGVNGKDQGVGQLVEAWEGHALTLTILAGYLVEFHAGDVTKANKLPVPAGGSTPNERIEALLGSYDEKLNPEERALLVIATAFRTGETQSGLIAAVMVDGETDLITGRFKGLQHSKLIKLIDGLVERRLLLRDANSDRYFLHPLVRTYYSNQLETLAPKDTGTIQNLHRRIKKFIKGASGEPGSHPTLQEVSPLVEAVHHAIHAGEFEEGFQIYWEKIRPHSVLVHQLGAIETDLSLVKEFFPAGNFNNDPIVIEKTHRHWLINEVGLCFAALGEMIQSIGFIDRAVRHAVAHRLWQEAAVSSANLVALQGFLGELKEARKTAARAYRYARRVGKDIIVDAASKWGWIAYLCGNTALSLRLFDKAKIAQAEFDPSADHLLRFNGVFYCQLLC